MNRHGESRSEPSSLVDVDRLTQAAVELVQIPSVNPFDGPLTGGTGETEVVSWLEGRLKPLGYEIERTEFAPGRCNLIATSAGGDGPVVGLAGHLDTVGVVDYEDPFSGRISDGRIYGRGACDMKGALACFVEVAQVIHDSGIQLPGKLRIIGTADEEHAMAGSALLGARNDIGDPVADHVIVGEPTELELCIAHKGQYAFPIRTFGSAVHSSIAEQGVNAIEAMMAVISSLNELNEQIQTRPQHPLCGSGSINVGVIRGGDMVSIVPDFCEIEVDRRVLPNEQRGEVVTEFEALLSQLEDERPSFRWEIGEPIVDALPLDTPADAPLVVVVQAALDASAMNSELMALPAATDAPNFGVPAVVWGPGSLSRAHTTDEYVDIAQLETAVHLYLDTVLSLMSQT